jgi:hypothetical protein
MAELSQFKLTLTEASDNGIKVEAAFETPDGVIYEQGNVPAALVMGQLVLNFISQYGETKQETVN